MRKWGCHVISAFDALILLILLLPVFPAQSRYYGQPQFLRDLADACGAWETWLGGLRRPPLVRRRHDCSAPAVTSFGIVTGVAIMLISFGPSVLFLYQRRLDTHATRSST